MNSIDFFGLKVSVFSKTELENSIVSDIENKLRKVYFGYSFGYFPFIKKTPELYHIANNFDVMVTDGRLFYLFTKLFGAPLQFDISIPNLSRLIFEISNRNKYSIMLIGSSKITNELATLNLRKEYPNAIICDGFYGGKFEDTDYLQIVRHVNEAKPDILFVGVSSPKKEYFVSKNKEKLNCSIIVPFGGMIDVLGGKVKPTPFLIKKLGGAAFYRLYQEPKRLTKITLLSIYEMVFRVIPIMIWVVVLKKRRDFFIPSLYGICNRNSTK